MTNTNQKIKRSDNRLDEKEKLKLSQKQNSNLSDVTGIIIENNLRQEIGPLNTGLRSNFQYNYQGASLNKDDFTED